MSRQCFVVEQGDWRETAQTVAHLGLSPPTVIGVDLSDDVLAAVAGLPHGEIIARALPRYAANCAGCHGAEGEGTAIAPPLNDASLRSQNTDEALKRTITAGIPGTLMAGWN